MATEDTKGSRPENQSNLATAKRKMARWGQLLVLPTAIGLIILNIIPIIQTLIMSFQNVSTFGESTFVGLTNYIRLFQDPEFWQSLRNTLMYALIQVPVSVALATILSALLNQKIKGLSVYRTIFFLPVIVAPTAIAMVWRWLYNSEYGLLNQILGTVGLEGSIQWLSDPDIVIWSLILVGIWSNVGYNI